MEPSSAQSQVVLALAHKLNQNSLSYEIEKNKVLDRSVEIAEGFTGIGTAVHIVLTGSPRPTFAETNAYLLERSPSRRDSADETRTASSFRGSYSILDNSSSSCVINESDRDEDEGAGARGAKSKSLELEDFLNEQCATDGAPKETGEERLKGKENNTPLVGKAIVNAVSTAKGLGLQSSRAKLLQGTIDRPLWDQRRWTDGECLFSDLVGRCGLESFENIGVAGAKEGERKLPTGELGQQLQKTTNLSANLITVPLVKNQFDGVDEDTLSEIARGTLRILKRKNSPPASKVCIVMPPEQSVKQEEQHEAIAKSLRQTFRKMEQYNELIGAPILMTHAQFEFVHV